jgi:tRNA 2-selenouridine synthase SelU
MDYCLEHGLIYITQRRHTSLERLAKLGAEITGDDTQERRRYIKGWTEKKMDWSLESRREALPPASQMRLDTENVTPS